MIIILLIVLVATGIFGLLEAHRFLRAYGTVSRIERSIAMVKSFSSGPRDFEDSYFFGLFRIRFYLGSGTSKGPSLRIEAPIPAEEESKEASDMAVRNRSYANILSEQLIQVIPRWPSSEIRMPKYLRLSLFGKEQIYELVPVVVEEGGYWRFWGVESDEDGKEGRRNKKNRRTFRVWDYVVKGDLLGVVLERRFSREKHGLACVAPRNGYIAGFQILNGAEVERGDVAMLLATPTDFSIEPEVSQTRPSD